MGISTAEITRLVGELGAGRAWTLIERLLLREHHAQIVESAHAAARREHRAASRLAFSESRTEPDFDDYYLQQLLERCPAELAENVTEELQAAYGA